MDTLTLKQLQEMKPGTIFATGIVKNSPDGIYMTDFRKGDDLMWVSKRGAIPDWAIYIHWADRGQSFIESQGDKILSEHNIRKLVPCDDEALSWYRN